MLSKEVLKKIAEIEIHTRRILSSTLMGDSRSAQKGSGFEFNQIRDYQMGDDVRSIDWKASARSGKILVKEYIEERNRTIMILLDLSASTSFASNSMSGADILKQVAAVLSLVAGYSKDRVGLILYTDKIEYVIPPAMGHMHVHTIIKQIFSQQTTSKKTNGALAIERLKQMKDKKTAVFLLSDCIDESLDYSLKSIASNHEIVVIRCLDKLVKSFPSVGFLTVYDPEDDKTCLLDTRSGKRVGIADYLEDRIVAQKRLYTKYGIDCLDLKNNETFIDDVIRFFRRRMTY
jgi:uncharacterized protein (DUF58 family)